MITEYTLSFALLRRTRELAAAASHSIQMVTRFCGAREANQADYAASLSVPLPDGT